ncbi:HipA domain-containing protein [Pseudomonas sp. MOB-449]|nr:HipA domain-containing protein [Pseudomonas sp. MOB-449]
MRQLEVTINNEHVGSLIDQNGVWALAYSSDWLNNPRSFDLSPTLPRSAGRVVDSSTDRPVQWFFDNLLPEEQARQLLASDAKIEFADAFGLLGYYGAESAGAITLLPGFEPIPDGGLQPLPDDVLSQRIRNLPRVSLTTGAPKRMSLAGAQHKLPVVVLEGVLYEPIGSRPSTHILKPNHPETDQYDNSVANEWFVMSVAQMARLNAAPVAIHRVPEPVYLIERFDRQVVDGQLKRLHVLDGCQLLGLDRQFKYQQASMKTLRHIVSLCRRKAEARIQLFNWLVFNILVGNNDAHLKNLSFYVTSDGVDLAPHYDLLCTAIYTASKESAPWLDAELVWKVEGMRTHAEVTREHVLFMGSHLGLPNRIAAKLMDELVKATLEAADRLLQSLSERFLAGERYLLRRIVHGVMRDMAAKLCTP